MQTSLYEVSKKIKAKNGFNLFFSNSRNYIECYEIYILRSSVSNGKNHIDFYYFIFIYISIYL